MAQVLPGPSGDLLTSPAHAHTLGAGDVVIHDGELLTVAGNNAMADGYIKLVMHNSRNQARIRVWQANTMLNRVTGGRSGGQP